MLHSRTLRYLDEVARCGSIRRAAQRLNVTPTAVNKQILLFEEERGIKIFERLSRGVRMTSAGEALIAHVRRTLRDYRETELYIEQLKGLRAGTIRLGTMSGLASGLLPQLLLQFHNCHPNISISIQTMLATDMVKGLIDGDLDLCLGYNVPTDPRIQAIERYDGRLGVVVSYAHRLAQCNSLRLQDCVPYPMVMPHDSIGMADKINMLFINEDTVSSPVYMTTSIELMKNVVYGGDFVSFMSPFDVETVSALPKLKFIPLEGAMPENILSICRHARRNTNLGITLLADALQQGIRTYAT